MTGSRVTVMAKLAHIGPTALQFGLAAVSLAAVVTAADYGMWSSGQPGAGLYPVCVGGLLLLLTAINLLIERRDTERPGPSETEVPDRRRLLGYVIGLALLAAGTPWFGYLVTSVCALLVILLVGERMKAPHALILAPAITLGGWGAFAGLLSVQIQAWPALPH